MALVSAEIVIRCNVPVESSHVTGSWTQEQAMEVGLIFIFCSPPRIVRILTYSITDCCKPSAKRCVAFDTLPHF